MELTLALDKDSKEPLQAQIFDQLRGLILSGKLHAGATVPPSRALAERLVVSRNTVIHAYERLAGEGYIESRGTAGMFVSPLLPDDALLVSDGVPVASDEPEETPEPVLCFAGSPGGQGKSARPRIDFWVGRCAASTFPIRVWRRLVMRHLEAVDDHLTDYCDPSGLPELRQAIAEHLGRARGMTIDANQVVVTSGSQDALNVVYRLVADRYDTFFVENPCYQGAALLFQSLGAKVHPVDIDGAGMKTSDLPETGSGVAFVTPSHQFPMGVTLTLERRLQLLQWAERTDSLIIEDDYDSDFRYDAPPLTALAGLDNCRRVFYLGTFSKSLGAGLRLGYAVVPRSFVPRTRVVKAHMSNGQPWLEQSVLTEFLRSGEFDRHLRRTRKVYKGRRDRLTECLAARFPETRISGSDSGLHLVWTLPRFFPPASAIQAQARAQGIGVYTLGSGAALCFGPQPRDDILLLGYPSLSESDIERAVERLGRLIDDMRDAGAEQKLDELYV